VLEIKFYFKEKLKGIKFEKPRIDFFAVIQKSLHTCKVIAKIDTSKQPVQNWHESPLV
jgi:hypothetical protein